MEEEVHNLWVTGDHLAAWQKLLRCNSLFLRELDAELQNKHNLTISDYDVLISIRDAPNESLRMSDLSHKILLTRSGITRLIQGLERDKLIQRTNCSEDARVCWISLTQHGKNELAEARKTHHAGINRLFACRLNKDEAKQLSHLLGLILQTTDNE